MAVPCFLDGPTFQKFIVAKPLDRGRTISGLLGLSAYSNIRRALAALANTRAFNNHFGIAASSSAMTREERSANEWELAIAKDYEILVGAPRGTQDAAGAKAKCKQALAQVGPLTALCEPMEFDAIDIDGCIEAIKEAEGGPKRLRLGACIRERSDLGKVNHDAPSPERAALLAVRVAEREEVLEKPPGI